MPPRSRLSTAACPNSPAAWRRRPSLITADHGCDPTWAGTDHTREHVPVLWFGPQVRPRDLGRRRSFADMGQTLAAHFALPALPHGEACFVP